MAKGSSSAILTLLALVFAGPLFYLGRYLYQTYYAEKNDSSAETEMVSPKLPVMSENSETSCRTSTPEPEVDTVDSSSYLLSLLGYAIGIGNVWRFPYLVGQYGGGAFVFAYLVCLFLVAMPLFMIELGLGQYTRVGTIATMTAIAPRWRGLAWSQMGMVSVIVAYYNVLLAYSCLYIIASCIQPLPWQEQGSEAYWNNVVLNSYSEGSAMGPVQWQVTVSLLVVYVGVFCAVGFGKKVLTDITWVTVLGPILLMIILFCRTVGLPGADQGIEFYLGKFDLAELYNAELWATACGQIIFSLSPGCGTGIALSSKARRSEDVYRVCLTVGLCNSAFSLFAGFAIFSILGNLAFTTDQDVAAIASESGTGLAFISIADGITHFGSASNAMSVLFFVMLLSLGLDSTFAWLETLVAAAEDLCRQNKVEASHPQIVAVLCVLLFIAGLPFCTRGGNNLLDVVDHFVGAWFLLFSCCMESIMFMLDFGWTRYSAAIKRATRDSASTPTGRVLSEYWRSTVCYIVPAVTSGLLLTEFVNNAFIKQYGGGDYSADLLAAGWVVFFTLVVVALSTLSDSSVGSLSLPDDESAPGAGIEGLAAGEERGTAVNAV